MNEELQEVRTLEIVAAEIRSYTWSMLANIIEIGRRLTEAKEMLPHGQFMAWCTENFGYSKSQTNNFMRLFEAYGAEQNSLFGAELNRQTFGTLNYSKALALLALPSPEDREAFVEEHDVESMTTRELQAAIREKQEAEEQLKAAEQKLQAALQDQEGSEKALAEARERIQELAKLNEELEHRPVEVAVEPVRDEEAIAAAVKEAREQAETEAVKAANKMKREHDRTLKELHVKLAEAKAAQEKAEQELSQTKTADDRSAAEAEKRIAEAQEKTERIRAELEEARKQLKASNADVTKFGMWFSQVQKDFNEMLSVLRQINEREPETGEKLLKGATVLLNDLLQRMQKGQK